MKRFAIPLQALVGLALLFGGAWFAVEAIVGPSAELESQLMATSNARLAASELASAWDDLVDRQRRAATALQDTEVLGDLGASIRNSTRRDRLLAQALQSARAQLGGQGQAALIGPGLEMIAGGDDVGALARLPGTIAAQEGGPSTRLERMGVDVMLVTSVPVGPTAKPAALVLAMPLSRASVQRLVTSLPTDTHVVLAHGGAPVTGTLDPKSLGVFDVKTKGSSVVLLGTMFAMHDRSLDDDSASKITAFGLSKVADGASARAIPQVRLLLAVVFGALVLMMFLLGVFAPKAAVEAIEVPATAPSVPDLAALPNAPSFAPQPTPAPDSDAHVAAALASASGSLPTIPAPGPSAPDTKPPPKIDFLSAPPASSQPPPPPPKTGEVPLPPLEPQLQPPAAVSDAVRFPASPSQSTSSLEAQFAQKTMPASKAPDGGIPLPPSTQSRAPHPFDAPTAPPPAPVAPKPPPPASPFDAIAQAARASAPPRPVASSMDGPDDLPAPKGGVPPEVAAAQRAEAQRQAYQTPPPKPSAISFAPTPYDPELLEPKREAIPLPGSNTPSAFGDNHTHPPRAPQQSAFPASSASTSGLGAPPPGGAGPFGAPSPFSSQPPNDGFGAPSTSSHGPSGTVRGLPPSKVGMSVPQLGPNMSSSRPEPAQIDSLQPFDEAHYRSVYDQFVGSKAQLGEPVDSITYEGFRSKLRSSEQALLDRHQCRAVRFQVLVRDRTVSLRPQLVR
ncbi:MAG: MXAN_5187 C-terminal domain-containing protein [Deltaproteobacteria bacterium]